MKSSVNEQFISFNAAPVRTNMCVVLETENTVLQKLGKHSAIELHVRPSVKFYFDTVLLNCLNWPQTCEHPASAW